ncbi:methylated-DNA--[protein]-cysteine S-methyltransferase [Parabacteroides sp. PF5-9]|uniref:bifunctional transcriptional activator/DNA repair enzyme AdaA n=1 Tax=Parabacteroides sp. PF5-9 TaxID=1742404 RepID=UPI00247657E0|nr:methylated-DNA--[protein]-cysteine S-methyltransferase [Parabacteroides sp. PF5-9]MDH6357498.1 AraC family transcriptional regulator of adaptative response/methylated-DNA-[protein]-cysteine methyltransferase [Parabacteroides sp. PF5-9]
METERDIFYKAFLERDSSFEGVFVVGVKTTGIFCRPTCPAKPKLENCEFFSSAGEAMQNGYRPCKVCKPLERVGNPPDGIKLLLKHLEENPTVKIKDSDLQQMGLEPNQVRRWFLKNYKQTFHAYQRMFRANNAFQRIQSEQNITDIAYDSGYDSLSGFGNMFKNVIGTSPQNSKDKHIVNVAYIETDLGLMVAAATDKGICMFEFADYKLIDLELRQLSEQFKAPLVQGDNPHFDTLKKQLDEYFKGERKTFDIPLDLVGTEFQKKVWLGLLQIPYGSTTTYGKQAELLGKPSSVRAVANANGKNKISIILPCHRVIGADGSLTGYGGGMWRKKRLLEFEKGQIAAK